MTAYGSSHAVAAIKQGALALLTKPLDPHDLLLTVRRILSRRKLPAEYIVLRRELGGRRGAHQIIGNSPSMNQALAALQRAAESNAMVLLEGENGTGKELFARALHALRHKTDRAFVLVDCAAMDENLLEQELFGDERTDAMTRTPGKFELAHGGTLFLDKIDRLPLTMQIKALRALDACGIDRIRGPRSRDVDVHLVAAINNAQRTEFGSDFMDDLYFRFSVIPVVIPPLRERQADIPILARHFVERSCTELKKAPPTLTSAALQELQRYSWPGNVRELQHCLERAVIMSDNDTIDADDLNLSLHAQRL
jgi:DNA-binding NtrC family response regulator